VKIRAGSLNDGRKRASGPTLDIVLRDELAATSWTVTVEAKTAVGLFVVGRLRTLPAAACGLYSRRIAVARVPGVLEWRVRLETPIIDEVSTLSEDEATQVVTVPGVVAEAHVELVTGRTGGGGPALEAVPGASYLLTGTDVVPADFDSSGIILARPGRVLEVSALNASLAVTYLLFWNSTEPPILGTQVQGSPLPIVVPAGQSVVRTFARPLVVTSALCWSTSSSIAIYAVGVGDLLVAAQVE
jgi:hypothetical protein